MGDISSELFSYAVSAKTPSSMLTAAARCLQVRGAGACVFFFGLLRRLFVVRVVGKQSIKHVDGGHMLLQAVGSRDMRNFRTFAALYFRRAHPYDDDANTSL